jgi:hypothetical protein
MGFCGIISLLNGKIAKKVKAMPVNLVTCGNHREGGVVTFYGVITA